MNLDGFSNDQLRAEISRRVAEKKKAKKKLPHFIKQRTVVRAAEAYRFYYQDGMTFKAIAMHFGVKEKTAKQLVFRHELKLRYAHT